MESDINVAIQHRFTKKVKKKSFPVIPTNNLLMELIMKKLFSVVLVVLLLSQLFSATALASEGQPAGSCPPAFEIHPFMDHSGDPMHHHIGEDQDLNGDGFICMKMLTPDLHLHVDN